MSPRLISNQIKPKSNVSLEALKEAIRFEYVDWTDPENNKILKNNLIKFMSDACLIHKCS